VRRVVALLLFAAVGVSVPLVPRISAKIPREDPVAIRVDADRRQGPLTPIWAFFGYDEPNYTYMKDGQELLSELAALSPVPVYVRAHNLLTTLKNAAKTPGDIKVAIVPFATDVNVGTGNYQASWIYWDDTAKSPTTTLSGTSCARCGSSMAGTTR